MEYILVNGGTIVWGPTQWNRRIFELEILEEFDISISLPQTKNDTTPINIGDLGKIVAVGACTMPEFHPLTETLDGPIWNFSKDVAEFTYTKRQLTVEEAKPNYTSAITNSRWKYEISGTTANIQGIDVEISTSRNNRNMWAIMYSLGAPKSWKFKGDVWIDLTAEDMKTLAEAVHTHVQGSYDEERRLHELVANAQYISDLLDIEQDSVLLEWKNNG